MECDKMKEENKLNELKELFKKIDKQTDLNATIIETKLHSIVIIFSDTESNYEEVITIDGEQVHIISEGVEYTKHSLDAFYNILKDNWSELK